MSDENPQMAHWNGGVTQRQLGWLKQQLAEAEAAGERVITASHHQANAGSAVVLLRASSLAARWY